MKYRSLHFVLLVLTWILLWYPVFAGFTALYMVNVLADAVGLLPQIKSAFLSILFLLLPFAGYTQANWLFDTWRRWKAADGRLITFVFFVFSATVPAAAVTIWLVAPLASHAGG